MRSINLQIDWSQNRQFWNDTVSQIKKKEFKHLNYINAISMVMKNWSFPSLDLTLQIKTLKSP